MVVVVGSITVVVGDSVVLVDDVVVVGGPVQMAEIMSCASRAIAGSTHAVSMSVSGDPPSGQSPALSIAAANCASALSMQSSEIGVRVAAALAAHLRRDFANLAAALSFAAAQLLGSMTVIAVETASAQSCCT
ncbi:MAG TPA: hypothetical protein VEC57_19880 [Candidatus Limnocylindrales bacterium]|nr:hypothetical protein [Candidatus Limnocylindrales bacterium]